jgi:hypothetical protein
MSVIFHTKTTMKRWFTRKQFVKRSILVVVWYKPSSLLRGWNFEDLVYARWLTCWTHQRYMFKVHTFTGGVQCSNRVNEWLFILIIKELLVSVCWPLRQEAVNIWFIPSSYHTDAAALHICYCAWSKRYLPKHHVNI